MYRVWLKQNNTYTRSSATADKQRVSYASLSI